MSILDVSSEIQSNVDRVRMAHCSTGRHRGQMSQPSLYPALAQNSLVFECARVTLLGGGGEVLDQMDFAGSLDQVNLPFRQIILRALQSNCKGVLLRHNHPSGECQPSEADIEVTRMLNRMLMPLGIQLVDHIIDCVHDSFSFRENGLL